MNRRANAAFLRNNFAWWSWLRSQLDLLLPWRRQFQVALVGWGVGQKIGDNIFQPWQIQHLNVEMKAKLCCCHSEMLAETRDNAVTSGLWSVYNSKA